MLLLYLFTEQTTTLFIHTPTIANFTLICFCNTHFFAMLIFISLRSILPPAKCGMPHNFTSDFFWYFLPRARHFIHKVYLINYAESDKSSRRNLFKKAISKFNVLWERERELNPQLWDMSPASNHCSTPQQEIFIIS